MEKVGQWKRHLAEILFYICCLSSILTSMYLHIPYFSRNQFYRGHFLCVCVFFFTFEEMSSVCVHFKKLILRWLFHYRLRRHHHHRQHHLLASTGDCPHRHPIFIIIFHWGTWSHGFWVGSKQCCDSINEQVVSMFYLGFFFSFVAHSFFSLELVSVYYKTLFLYMQNVLEDPYF